MSIPKLARQTKIVTFVPPAMKGMQCSALGYFVVFLDAQYLLSPSQFIEIPDTVCDNMPLGQLCAVAVRMVTNSCYTYDSRTRMDVLSLCHGLAAMEALMTKLFLCCNESQK